MDYAVCRAAAAGALALWRSPLSVEVTDAIRPQQTVTSTAPTLILPEKIDWKASAHEESSDVHVSEREPIQAFETPSGHSNINVLFWLWLTGVTLAATCAVVLHWFNPYTWETAADGTWEEIE